jgi:hypothetical protein
VTAGLLAGAAALAFAIATVVQHRAAAETAGTSGLGLMRRLLGRPAWLAAQAASVAGVLLHAGALRNGSVVLVQPLLSLGLVFSLGLGTVVDRRHPGRPLPGRLQWAAAGAVAAGLAVFLLAASPAAGAPSAPLGLLTVCVLASLALDGGAVFWARRPDRPHRPVVLGTAAGLGFGVSGLLLKQVLAVPVVSVAAAVSVVELAAVALCAFVLTQSAFHAGPLVASLPVMTVCEPAIAVLLAGPLFGEWPASGPAEQAGQLVGALLLAGGLVVLARTGPQVAATTPVASSTASTTPPSTR